MKTFYKNETTSTMDWVREVLAARKLDLPFVVMAGRQTAGRGRGGSRWLQSEAQTKESNSVSFGSESTEHASLREAVTQARCFGPCTFLFPADHIKIPVNWSSLAAGCAVADAIDRVRQRIGNQLGFARHLPSADPYAGKIKWPNDVWAWPSPALANDGRPAMKIAGLLCESSFRGHTLQFVTVGVGLNVFEAPSALPSAGSLLEMWGLSLGELKADQHLLIQNLLAEEIEREMLDYFSTERTAEQLRLLALERSLPLGTRLSVNKGMQVGAFAGISLDGGLLLEGQSEPVVAADVQPLENGSGSSVVSSSVQWEKQSTHTGPARLLVDFGNSTIHWCCEMGAEKTQGHAHWQDFDKKNASDVRLFAKTQFAQDILKALGGSKQVELVWSSVGHGGLSASLMEAVEELLLRPRVDREIALFPLHSEDILQAAGLVGDYAAGQMGVDRALQGWAAVRRAQSLSAPVAVLSFGTALTGLVVNEQGRLLESFILPGAFMSLAALNNGTARLPKVKPPEHYPSLVEEPPFTTHQSMLRGLVLQAVGLIEHLQRQHNLGLVVVTGGGASPFEMILRQHVSMPLEIEEDLVLRTMSDFVSGQTQSRFRLMAEQGDADVALPEKVLQSMLRARLSKRRSQRVALDKVHFRRLGGRLENAGVGVRIDRHLAEKFKFHNRHLWRERIDIGEVMVEQNSPKNHISDAAPASLISIKSTYVLKQGDQVWLFHPPEYEPDMATHVEVVYDDGDAAVFCKPGNLVVHAAGLYGKNTFIEIIKKMGFADAAPVHRIDRETSGLLVCARSTALRRDLSLSFRDASVKKMYLAVTRGTRVVPREFKINFPIGPALGSRIRLKLWENQSEGLDALTHCVLLSQWEDHSLFACLPQTGRTNQIRVHLAAIGHWIVGDKMYHPEEDVFLQFYEEGYTDFVAEKVLLPRHWLHNTGIQFLSQSASRLGQKPLIAPLTDDLLVHEPTRLLLQAAGFSLDPKVHAEQFSDLFSRLLNLDFSEAECLAPEAHA
ncbi:MAG: hypothetical protein RIR26_116 [Pseudomonadota bacterium]|jgi:23S rRNA pseudouridine1911/1915/1917 synthase